MQKRYSFDETMELDRTLHDLAMYAVTKGMIVMPSTMEDFMDLRKKANAKFNELKRLIQTNECTFEFIKNKILGSCGAYPKVPLHTPEEEVEYLLNATAEDFADEREYETQEQRDVKAIQSVLKSFGTSLGGSSNLLGLDIPAQAFLGLGIDEYGKTNKRDYKTDLAEEDIDGLKDIEDKEYYTPDLTNLTTTPPEDNSIEKNDKESEPPKNEKPEEEDDEQRNA